MEIKPNFLSRRGVVMVVAMLIGGSSGALLQANTHAKESMIVAQTGRIIKGVVTDQHGEPLIGCNIVVVGSQKGVITDIDGRFSLDVPAEAKQLKISYIGYQDQVVDINERTNVKIILKEDDNALDEVVVVGYGTQKKATLTGAVEQVSSKALESRAITNVGLALQGQTPGLVVTRNSPRPGNEGLDFTIRGTTSVNGGSPLIIVDGVPTLNTESFQNLNSDDIESISVLKDGAASIYGAKAANGVILVTTKRGKSGKVNVDYSFNMCFTSPGITAFSPDMGQYATMWLEANKEEKTPNWWAWVSEENMLRMQQNVAGIYPTQYYGEIFLANSSRTDELFANRNSYQHNLSVSGSTEKSNYRISLAYADNQANLTTAYDGQKQLNLRLNYGLQMTDWLRFESIASVIRTSTESPSTGLDNSLYGYDVPFFPSKNPLGQWYANFGTVGNRNSVAATSEGGRDEKVKLTTRIDMKVVADIWKGISFEGTASFQNEEYRRERYVVPVQTYDWFGNPASELVQWTNQNLIYPDNPSNVKIENNPGYLVQANNLLYQFYSALLKYNRTFAEQHNVSVVAGLNAETTAWRRTSTAREKFEDNGVYDLGLADASSKMANSGGKGSSGTYSYIARVNYNYSEKYMLELLGRRDGDSKFADGYRFKNFGSFSLGWVFTQENFMKFVTPVLDFGKIRFSYGEAGNNAGLGDFLYASAINSGVTYLGSPLTGQISTTLKNSGLINQTLTWERVKQKNIGVDLNFLNNRLTVNFDYFWKDNKGMQSQITYPSVLGADAPKSNTGHLSVKGWELSVGWRDQISDFSYFANFNVGDTKTMLKKMEGADTYVAGKNAKVVGYPLNSFFLYRTDGYFADEAEVNRYYELYGEGGGELLGVRKETTTELRPGDTKRLDLNGDNKIDGANGDLQFVGDGDPHYVFGINLGGAWKGVDVSAMFQGVGKQYIMRTGWMAYPFAAIFSNQNPSFLGNTWTAENPTAEYPRLTSYAGRAAWNYGNNDFMLQNSRYIRLKSLIIGYTLPKQWTRKVKLEKVRVYFSGNDLWEATSIKDGFDPEMGEVSQISGYPFYRTWSFGVNVGF